MFFVAGWLPAAWGTRIPAIKADLGLSDSQLALSLLAALVAAARG